MAINIVLGQPVTILVTVFTNPNNLTKEWSYYLQIFDNKQIIS